MIPKRFDYSTPVQLPEDIEWCDKTLLLEDFLDRRLRGLSNDELFDVYMSLERFGPEGQKAICREFARRIG